MHLRDMSVFVWLDYSERERRKMLEVVDLFREHDTRDERMRTPRSGSVSPARYFRCSILLK